jgi:hypothetical protein
MVSQFDLFADAAPAMEPSPPRTVEASPLPADMDDKALIDAIPEATLPNCDALADEAGRRRLAEAVPALARLCQRLCGFGATRLVPEQVAALRALAAIGGDEAADAVARMIEQNIVQGPTFSAAVRRAAQLRSTLPATVLQRLLQHDVPDTRADACRCVYKASPEITGLLVDLLSDLDPTVASSAACALGRLGRSEALPKLKELLRVSPSEEVIEAIWPVADKDCPVLLRRGAKSSPALTNAVLDALDALAEDHPQARVIAADLRQGARPR